VKKQSKNDNYFLQAELPASDLAVGQGEMSEQSRFISAQFEKILDSLPFYVLLVDSSHHVQFANSAFRKTFKTTLAKVQGAHCPRLVHGCDHYPACAVDQAIREGATEKIHFNQQHNRWLLTTAYPTGAKTKDGLDIYYHTVRDVTDERQVQESLKASENRYRGLFEEMKDVIFVMSPDGTLQDMNPAGLELLQIQPHKLGRTNLFTDLNLVASTCEFFIEELRTKNRVVDFELTFVRPDGKTIVVLINASMDKSGADDGVIRGIMRDLTRNRELEELSTLDVLTGLYNRGFFQTFLMNKVRNMRAGQEAGLSLLFFDIDNFKSYNDTYGHLEGDFVLKKVADAIRAALRAEDVACRYGGEEFSVILSCDAALAVVIAERVRRTIEDTCSDFADKHIKRGIRA
jgi:diguanylate cyclase (GGDEF)-like protein/PAS domain S-box-containing protein